MKGRNRAVAVYSAKAVARRLRWSVADLRRPRVSGVPRPPRAIDFVGGGDFERTGREYLELFQSLGSLTPEDDVLDVGCGIGRMAIPLLDFLGPKGSYAGFDVGKSMVRWCQRHITKQRPDFQFSWAPVYNRKYNPFGNVSGSDFRFPYADQSFDFVFATSLFTHLTAADSEHYLAEIGRVLRPGGRALLTFFVLNPHSRAEVEAGRAAFDFRHPVAGGLTIDPHEPEAAIAFELGNLEGQFERTGLRIKEPVHFGLWANTPGGVSGQDVVVAER